MYKNNDVHSSWLTVFAIRSMKTEGNTWNNQQNGIKRNIHGEIKFCDVYWNSKQI